PWPEPPSLAALVADPAAYLRGAASFTWHDALAPARGEGPAAVATLTAQEYPDPGDPGVPRGLIAISLTYADGLGRSIQETIRVEPGIGIVCDAGGTPVVGPDGEVVR